MQHLKLDNRSKLSAKTGISTRPKANLHPLSTHCLLSILERRCTLRPNWKATTGNSPHKQTRKSPCPTHNFHPRQSLQSKLDYRNSELASPIGNSPPQLGTRRTNSELAAQTRNSTRQKANHHARHKQQSKLDNRKRNCLPNLRTSHPNLELPSQLDTRLTNSKLSAKSWNLPAEIGSRLTNAEIASTASKRIQSTPDF